ncbi:flagellar filament capping protein FliD [Heliorestis convoluta]|uniref:Flagellar hook-associated protein 2 n=1 Tax=Heliorestis convoluta TaxID=356322 RepID=A0A5Q2N2K4_9FIRM|nr:flagellar filament capping protein FliD [Heliorestis convoluta]QGG47502.1 flagellar hook-associated protein 2 [Heliorestis convoluta]
MTIRFGGIASGLDTESMIKEMMRAHRMRADKIFHEKTRTEWRKAEYNSLRNDILNFRNKLFDNFQVNSSKFNPKSVISSNTSILTATASTEAGNVTNRVEVKSLASGVNLASGSEISKKDDQGNINRSNLAAQLGLNLSGTDLRTKQVGDDENVKYFTMNINGKEIEVMPEKDTMQDLVRKINRADAGVHAVYDMNHDRFFLRTTGTGEEAKIRFDIPTQKPSENGEELVNKLPGTITAERSAVTNLFNALLNPKGNDGEPVLHFNEEGEEQGVGWFITKGTTTELKGKNAEISVNGIKFEGATNNISVAGITYNLQSLTPDNEPITITINNDINKAVDTVKEFVDLYNSLVGTIQDKLKEPFHRDFHPLTDEQKREMSDREVEQWEEKARSGMLRNDAGLSRFLSNLRLDISNPIEGLSEDSQYKSLASIGVTTGQWSSGAVLEINENKLREALANDPDVLNKLFRGDDGMISRLRERALDMTDRTRGYLYNLAGTTDEADPNSSLGRRLNNFERQLADFERRMKMVEDRYWKQFTAMEKAMDQMNNQSNWLMMQFMNPNG